MVLSLPTRNGNPPPELHPPGEFRVLSLPTRNGNTVSSGKSPSVGSGFEPTYKEWKLYPRFLDLDSFFLCFEPTYKEWKPSQSFNPLSVRASFEPTYKEWKHYCVPKGGSER